MQHYAAKGANRGLLHGRFEAAGQVHSLLCLSCRRVFQYAIPHDSDPDGDNCLQCGQPMELTERCSHCGWSYADEEEVE